MKTQTLQLSAGPIQVRDSGGDGDPVLLVHGLFVDGRLWDGVAAYLEAAGLRVVIPDLPLGAHKTPMRPGAELECLRLHRCASWAFRPLTCIQSVRNIHTRSMFVKP